jgi:hypothetical protein
LAAGAGVGVGGVVFGAVVEVVVFVFAAEGAVVVVVPPTPVVVVVVVEHTVMVTFCGNGELSTVPAEGFWLCTWPGVPPLWEQSIWLNTGVRPGVFEMLVFAALWVSPTTLGTVAEQGPFEMTRFIGVFGGCCVPAAGVCDATLPVETCWEQACVCVPTVRLAEVIVLPADVCENPTTLGTFTED